MSNAPSPESAPSDPVAAARDYTQSIVDTVRDPLLVLDADLRVRSASRSFYEDFGVKPEETEGRLVYELGNGQWDIPDFGRSSKTSSPRTSSFRDFEVTHDFEGIGRRRMLLNGRKVRQPGNHSELILLAIEDVTPTWRAGVDFAANRERYRVIVEGATGFAIFTFDTEGVITSWNAGAEKMLGYSEAEILGAELPHHLHARGPRGPARRTRRCGPRRAEGRALDERWHLKKGGEPF